MYSAPQRRTIFITALVIYLLAGLATVIAAAGFNLLPCMDRSCEVGYPSVLVLVLWPLFLPTVLVEAVRS
jgi:hypothetical protein